MHKTIPTVVVSQQQEVPAQIRLLDVGPKNLMS